METNDQEKLSRIAACTFVTARAFNIWVSEFEKEARRKKMTFKHETKYAINQISDGLAKVAKGLEHFEDWAVMAGITDSGHNGDAVAFDSFMTDGAWVAVLTALTFNASHEDDKVRTIVESYCKNSVHEEPLIPWDFIESLKPNRDAQ